MPKLVNYEGQKLGKLKVISRAGSDKQGRATWLCHCDCGHDVIVAGFNLKRKQGCIHCRKGNTQHNLYYTRVHRIWSNMKNRCYNPNSNRWYRYGGRGIIVCDEWKNNFKDFYDWAMSHGYRDDLTIERINNDGNYEPSNCKWIPLSEQAKNMTHPKRGKYNKRK